MLITPGRKHASDRADEEDLARLREEGSPKR